MRIVHFSDWHWSFFEKLPEADLYVCTGDMLQNYPTMRDKYPDAERSLFGLTIDADHEREKQSQAIQAFVAKRGFREILGSPDAPIVVVKGNHDFVPLAPLFAGCGPVHEFVNGESVDVCGIRVTGHRGIPWISGIWDDEERRCDLIDRVRRMPAAALYLTHYPPSGIGLDGFPGSGYGLDEMLNVLLYRGTAVHCFGHIHECGGQAFKAGDVLFSNAATTYNIIEGSTETGWRGVPR